ncbi:MAG TPA: ribonuclease III [Acidimicrobiia bacterium]|nr:ribonuclease III [Acidimicrobiia bacterium]
MTDRATAPLEDRLGYHFGDPALLQRALAHRSYCAEHPGMLSNERLEFLGDAVVGLVVTDRMYRDEPELPEGELAKARAAVVSSEALAGVATDLGLGDFVLLGRGEEQSGGRRKTSILADAIEAVIGAVYLDAGWEAASKVVLTVLGDRITEATKGPGVHDYKTRLQELAIQMLDEVPRYEVSDSGPDHAKEFEATVTLDGQPRGTGVGTSKKQAEQEAAARAWEWLRGQTLVAASPDTTADDSGEAAGIGQGSDHA